MKKLAGMAMVLIIMFGTGNFANAATKCVALNASSTCSGTPASFSGKVDWSATCNSIPVTGVGVCSSILGSPGDTADSIATENSTTANKYCWCKMTSPTVSKFVFANEYGSSSLCSRDCADGCVKRANGNATFRAGLFSNMQ